MARLHGNPERIATLSERLTYARRCRRYTHRLICKYTGVNRHTFAQYEAGKVSWPWELVRVLCWIYEVPVEWAVDGVGELPCHPPPPVDHAKELLLGRPKQNLEPKVRERWWSIPSAWRWRPARPRRKFSPQ